MNVVAGGSGQGAQPSILVMGYTFEGELPRRQKQSGF